MKRLFCALFAALMLAVCLASCDDGEEVLGILPSYMGPPVTTTDHEFTKDDFYVLANYENRDESIDDYEFYIEGMENGYYVIQFTYKDVSNPLYVKCDVPIYPSDLK